MTFKAIFVIFLLCNCGLVNAATSLVATSANFLPTMKLLVESFEAQSPHKINLSVASSGKLYAQISNGAPFDAFFSADQTKPQKLETENKAVLASRFTYAVGQLAFYTNIASNKPLEITNLPNGKIAIANPKFAPYGAAAIEALNNLYSNTSIDHKLIFAENVAQAYQFAATGNADFAVIALSQTVNLAKQDFAPLSASLYTPILQDAVLLKHGENNEAALQFLVFVKGEKAKDIMRRFGYK